MGLDFEAKVGKKRSRKPSTVIRKILEGEYNGVDFLAKAGNSNQTTPASSIDSQDTLESVGIEAAERLAEGSSEVALAMAKFDVDVLSSGHTGAIEDVAMQDAQTGMPTVEVGDMPGELMAVPRGRRSGLRRGRVVRRPVAPPLPDGQRLSRRSRSGRHEIGKRAANARWEKLRAMKDGTDGRPIGIMKDSMDSPYIAAAILVCEQQPQMEALAATGKESIDC